MINKIKKYIDKNKKQLVILIIFVFLIIMISIIKKLHSKEKETFNTKGRK